jgi:tRNA(adenine34) deaminase
MGNPDEILMREALEQAREAFGEGEVPVGAVVALGGVVVARAHNRCEAWQDPTAHAEMLALRWAARAIGSYRLVGAALVVTVEPCVMCAGALHLARVARVVYGCEDPKGGALGSRYQIHADGRLNHRLDVIPGVLEDSCRDLMQSFFRRLRA